MQVQMGSKVFQMLNRITQSGIDWDIGDFKFVREMVGCDPFDEQ
jgi:hypothetical protein